MTISPYRSATEDCGVHVRREAPSLQRNGQIAVGHQWLEVFSEGGYLEFSAVFWPDPGTGSIWLSRGLVRSPDPNEGKNAGISSRRVRRRIRSARTCDEIRQCIRAAVARQQLNPPNYRLIWYNCRTWSKHILETCCLIVR